MGGPKIVNISSEITADKKQDIVNEIKRESADVFHNGVGKISDNGAKLFTEPGFKPIYIPTRKVPYAIQGIMV